MAFLTANGSITAQADGPAIVPAVVSVDVSHSWAAPSDSVTSLSAPSNSTISRNNSAVGLSRLALSSPGSRSHTAKTQRQPASVPLLRPPKEVHWSRAMQQLTSNSSKVVRGRPSPLVSGYAGNDWLLLMRFAPMAAEPLTVRLPLQLEELMQTARQAVTVTLRALAQLRKAALEAARDRDRLGTQGRLAMRRAAVQVRRPRSRCGMPPVMLDVQSGPFARYMKPQRAESIATAPELMPLPVVQSLIGSTRTLLCDLSHFYGLTDGQAGRTLSRRMQNLLKVGARSNPSVMHRLKALDFDHIPV